VCVVLDYVKTLDEIFINTFYVDIFISQERIWHASHLVMTCRRKFPTVVSYILI